MESKRWQISFSTKIRQTQAATARRFTGKDENEKKGANSSHDEENEEEHCRIFIPDPDNAIVEIVEPVPLRQSKENW
jgi:hypothetical protein